MVPSASASLGETGRGNSARLAWRGGRDRADAALNLLVRFYRESTHLHRQTHPAFSPTSRFALRNGSSVHLNINEDCGHFAAPTRPGALLRIAAALLLAARRRTGRKSVVKTRWRGCGYNIKQTTKYKVCFEVSFHGRFQLQRRNLEHSCSGPT